MSEHHDIINLVEDIVLAPHIAAERQAERNRQAIHEREAARSSGVRYAGMDADRYIPPSEASIAAAAEAKVVLLNSNTGKARRAIASAQRECIALHGALDAVAAALSRGDGSAVEKAEKAQVALRDLRQLVADMAAYVRLAGEVA